MGRKKPLRQQGINHYNRMIIWVKTQKPSEKPNSKKMRERIFTDWENVKDDPYCSKYFRSFEGLICEECELYTDKCCNGLWIKLDSVETWEEWLEVAEMIKGFIRKNG